MAVLNEIRKRSSLLLITVGGAIVLFVLQDLTQSSGGPTASDNVLAEIYGESVLYTEFDEKLKNEIAALERSQPTNEQVRESVRNRLWQRLLNERIMDRQYSEVGLSVSSEEIFEQIKGNRPSAVLTQYFTNPQTGRILEDFATPFGTLDGQAVIGYLQRLLQSEQADSWIAVEDAIKNERLNTKYLNLIKKGLYATNVEAERSHTEQNKSFDIRYVVQRFSSISNDQVEVSEQAMKEYYEAHKSEADYQQEEDTRSFDYVVYEAVASQDDSVVLREDLTALKNEFTETQADTLFVNAHADSPYNIRYYKQADFLGAIGTALFEAEKGQAVGPFLYRQKYALAKVLEEKQAPDSVKARHILLKLADNDTNGVLSLADSLKKVIKREQNFESLATQFSQDPGSAAQGGDLGWFTEGTMVKEFNNACFAGKVGDMPIVQSPFGVHLIEITEQTQPVDKRLIAIVDKQIVPSDATLNQRYDEASAFSINHNTGEKFKEAANTLGMRQANDIKETDKVIAGLDYPRELIRWAYRAEIAEVSPPFEIGNKFVVAHLNTIRQKGTLPFEDERVQDLVRYEVEKQAKAIKVKEDLAGIASLEGASQKISAPVQEASRVTFSSYSIPGLGVEAALQGIISTLEQGNISQPIEGTSGIYMVGVQAVNDPSLPQDLSYLKRRLISSYEGQVNRGTFDALEDDAKVVDNRAKFY